MISPPILNYYYPMKGWIFVNFFINKRSKDLTMQINFLQPSLIIFTQGADIFGHDSVRMH